MLLKCAVLCVVLALGCGPCGGGLSVAGDTPFERCIARESAAPPAAIGAIKLSLHDRVLTLDGLPAAPRIAFFQGPGMATQLSSAEAFRALAATPPDVMLVLGGIGLESKIADPWLAALAGLGPPVLFLAGGRDSIATTDAALGNLPAEARARVVNVSGVYRVNLSGYVLVLVSGADSGVAAIAENACGFSDKDAAAVRAVLEDDDERPHVLVSWEIPARKPGDRSHLANLGSGLLADLREAATFKAGVYAWPDSDVLRPATAAGGRFEWGQPSTDFEISVPRIAGAAHERSDGTRQLPSYVTLRLEPGGIVPEMPR